MNHNSLSPVNVVEFNKDYLIELVRYKTGWDQRNEVSDKTQLNYLCNYLAHEQIGCTTILVEDEYIDRHYLEDYSEYYARCFPSHPRKCCRVHFFKETFSQQHFISGLADNDEDLKHMLQRSYLGFVVIRPIPHTFFAKICLDLYSSLKNRKNSKLLTRQVSVSLFGITLSVDTVPFLEQDKVVSACATSAVWTALSASADFPASRLPSPSAITKAASNSNYDGTRTFPTIGLTPPQVARSLKAFGGEPSIFTCETYGDRHDFKEHLYSYLQSGIPVIVGGDIYDLRGANVRQLGKHLVCVVGYSTKPSVHLPGIRLLSHEIDKIYIHDDRYGPFVKVRMTPKAFEYSGKEMSGLALSVNGTDNEIFVPEIAIVGLDHKVRITYGHVFNICTSLVAHSALTLEDLNQFVERANTPESTDESPEKLHAATELAAIFQIFTQGIWDISLTTSVNVKRETLDDESFYTFNGMMSKSSLLLQNMPKHVWRCRVLTSENDTNSPFTDILFDATEVPQGRVLVGFITHTAEAVKMWNHIAELIQHRTWQKYNLTDNSIKHFISCIIRFFGELKDRTYLNTLYGPAGLPRRALKPGESDEFKSIQLRPDTLTFRRGGVAKWDRLDPSIKYIWVITELGDIVLGEDKVNEPSEAPSFQGHPTLLDGKPGRVAGELLYSAQQNSWVINLQSRAYSGHLDRRSADAKFYLENVINGNLAGLDVVAQEEVSTAMRVDDAVQAVPN